jgi:hypothetical protein
LWFSHYCLAALQALRSEGADTMHGPTELDVPPQGAPIPLVFQDKP